ncbi:MAG TPA: protein-disulfide reductase DsbD [Thiobacillaceae bacterium]|nr:protein-disulfide reductase DsbD [Thiobacillaceae bacterium]
MRLLLSILLCLIASWTHAAEDELLEPDKAFRFSARMLDAGQIEARFQIADGYYLYRDKIKFSATGAKLGSAKLPPGPVKQDEFFGKVTIYHGDVRIPMPVKFDGAPPKRFELKAGFQGCAELGVCYPPQEALAVLTLPAAAASAPAAAKTAAPAPLEAPAPEPLMPAEKPSGGVAEEGMQTQDPALIARLRALAGDLAGMDEPEFLPPEEAFKATLVMPGADGIEARLSIAPGHYLYRDKVRIAIDTPAGVQVGELQMPPAEEKQDPNFGRMFIYHHDFAVRAALTGLPEGTAELKGVVTYQGCSDKGICYPPIDQPFVLAVGAGAAAASPAQPAAAPAPGADESETGQITALLQGGNYWLVIGTFFLLGLGLSLTPCVFPMIPILSGIIVGQGKQLTKRRGFLLSLAYVLGMAITYAIAGVIAGMSGTLISNALQNPMALGIGAAIFVALAFSMFGFYELQMPSFLQSRFTEASNKIHGGKLGSVFMMGAISALIVGPCVAAPLAGALLYIGQSGDLLLGGVSLFTLAMGMGVPLLLVGVSAGTLLPRAGGWMEAVKQFFGVVMLGVAIWLITPLISEVLQMFLWAALLIVSGVYLKAVDPLAGHAHGWTRFWKGVGIIILVSGVALLLGALGGSRDLLQPLSVYQGGGGAAKAEKHLQFQRVRSLAELDQAVQSAQGRYVMLDFYADWCVSCKEMERFTFTDPQVQAKLADVLLLQVDVTANSTDDKALLKRFNLFGPPGIIFWDKTGQEVAYRVVGYEPAEKFLQSLAKAIP